MSTSSTGVEATIVRIGELARRTGVSPRSLRHYERRDLLHARRDANGWREYDEAAVDRVGRIATLLGDGLTLDGVARVMPCLERPGDAACDDPHRVERTYRSRLAVVDDRLSRLTAERDRLAAAAGRAGDRTDR